jgi:hypothetical protein
MKLSLTAGIVLNLQVLKLVLLPENIFREKNIVHNSNLNKLILSNINDLLIYIYQTIFGFKRFTTWNQSQLLCLNAFGPRLQLDRFTYRYSNGIPPENR